MLWYIIVAGAYLHVVLNVNNLSLNFITFFTLLENQKVVKEPKKRVLINAIKLFIQSLMKY